MHSTHLTNAQQRLWQLEQSHPGSWLVNLPLTLRMRGALDVDALAWAVTELGRRNDILRSEILMCNGRAYQVVKSLELRLETEDYCRLDEEQRDRVIAKRRSREIRRPFDHSRAPLTRFFLFREAPERHVFLMVASRILLDESSFDPLLHELAELYEARVAGREPPPEQGFNLTSLVALEGESTGTHDSEAAATEYWRARLAGMPGSLDLATDRPTPKRFTGTANHVRLALQPEAASSLRKLSRDQGVSLEVLALASLEVALARYIGQTDFGVVIHVRDRTAARARPLGMHENPTILRSDVPSADSFGDLVRKVERALLEAQAHPLEFQKLAHSILGACDLDELPLHQLSFRFKKSAQPALRLGSVELEPVTTLTRTSTVALEFRLEEHGDLLQVGVDAMSQLFDAETAARLCRCFRRVLEAAPDAWSLPPEDIPVLAPEDERTLLFDFNDNARPWEQDVLVHRLFERQVDRRPDAPALVFEERTLTFRELDERANRIARALVRRGVRPDTLVGLCLERSPEMVAAMLAIHKAGGAYVPLDPDYPSERIRYLLEDSGAKVLVTDQILAERFENPPELLLLDKEAREIASEPCTRLTHEEHPEQLAYVIYTSGSTGKPKGVMVEHRNVVSFFRGMQLGIGLDEEGTWLSGTSISFDISVLEILGSLCHGRRLVLLGEVVLGQVQDPRYTIPALIERHRVTHFQCTPSQVRVLLIEDEGRRALSSLRQLVLGGEPLPRELADELVGLVGGEVLNLYGPTETTVWSTIARVERGRAVNVGRPIANTAVFVLDRAGRVSPPGAPGELYITGPGVARGYLGRPELTAQRFVENRLRPDLGPRMYATGDLVRYAPDGRIIHLGRNDHQVKIRGHRVELGELESAIRRIPGVTDTAVIARGSESEKRLAAYVVVRDDFPGVDSLRSRLRASLPEFMLPASITLLPALPLTPNGKVDRTALPVATRDDRPERRPPRDEREQKLCEIWQDALDVPQIGIDESFFDLGGHSLTAVKISNEVYRAFGVRVPLAALFESPNIETFAERLGNVISAGSADLKERWTTLVPMRPEGSLPPFFCVAGLGGNPMNLRHVAAGLGPDQPFYGLQMRGVDGRLKPHREIRAMAEEFLHDVRSVQPTGPYYLGGYSAGGLCALEMAQRLRDAGERVALVVFFDTMNPMVPLWTFPERLDAHLQNLRERGPTYFANRLVARMRAEATRTTRRVRARFARRFPFRFRHDAVWEATEIAMNGYQPLPYEGDVLLLQADSALTAGEGIGFRPHETNGWGELIKGNFEIVQIASSHTDIVSVEASPYAAEALRSALRRARARMLGPELRVDPSSSGAGRPVPRRRSDPGASNEGRQKVA